jgi:hypothetical protein
MVIRRVYRGDETASSASAVRTRQREKISGVGEKIEVAKIRYQAAWLAARDLNPEGTWVETYRWLDTKDIRGPLAADDLSDLALANRFKKHKDGAPELGQGTYLKSWIWGVAVADDADPEDTLRIEWAKSSANAARWREELELVPVEMGRTLAYFEWEAQQWAKRVGSRLTAPPGLQEALDIYARQQHAIIHQRIALFASTWLPFLARSRITASWTDRYKHLVPTWAWVAPKRGDPVGCECSCYCQFSMRADFRKCRGQAVQVDDTLGLRVHFVSPGYFQHHTSHLAVVERLIRSRRRVTCTTWLHSATRYMRQC